MPLDVRSSLPYRQLRKKAKSDPKHPGNDIQIKLDIKTFLKLHERIMLAKASLLVGFVFKAFRRSSGGNK